MKPTCSLRKALEDRKLLGAILAGDSWRPWRVLLLAAMGEKLTDAERVIFRELTKRDREPDTPCEEFVGVIGRRGGKSRAISVLATYLAALVRYPMLVRGERGILLIIAPDVRQASITLNYITAAFEQSPILAQLIQQRTADALELTNGVSIEVRSSSFRRLRGPSFICCICDESAFFQSDDWSANVDSEIINAILPGLGATNGQLFMISSPYARRGELWRSYDAHFGKPSPILVAQAPTKTMNSSLPSGIITRAFERDPASAAAEYGAEFRSDLEAYVSIEAVRACMPNGIYERPRQWGAYQYQAFVDPAGGSGTDSMTLAIGHNEPQREVAVLDCIREIRPPFSPELATEELSQIMKSYGLTVCVGDKYAGLWCVEQFGKHNVLYKPIAEAKSQLYAGLLATINSRRCDLLDNKKLLSQLTSLERRTSRSARDQIDHLPGGHDDVSNAVAGVITHCLTKGKFNFWALADMSPDQKPGSDAQQQSMSDWRRLRKNLWIQTGYDISLTGRSGW
jgi:hypothetical protein